MPFQAIPMFLAVHGLRGEPPARADPPRRNATRKEPMRELRTQEEADAAFGEEVALVYKHSTRCPVSLMAHGEVERFAEAHPEVPVYRVDVIFGRPVSAYLAQRTGIAHHSPQAILLRGGEPAWSASHMGITAEALEDGLGAGRQPR